MMTAEQMTNLAASQRQENRRRSMLPDRARAAEKAGRDKLGRKQIVFSYGNFLASLIHDGWWVTITLRDRSQPFTTRRHGRRTLRGKIRRHYRDCHIRYGQPDGKIKAWRPASKLDRPHSPFTHQILSEVHLFMEFLQASAGAPIGYIIAEEIGELNGRWHLHLLICGVSNLRRTIWYQAAFQIWGRTRIELYDPRKAAAFYAAKYAAKQLGEIHLCGTLRGSSMEACEDRRSGVVVGGRDVVRSDSMPSDFYHSPVTGFRKPCFARTLPARVWRQHKNQNWMRFDK